MKRIKVGMSNMKSEVGRLDTLKRKLLFNLTNDFEFEYSKDPDFLFVGDRNDNFDYLKKNCVLIFYTNENMHPNFELFDYCIGYNNDLSFGDRYCFYLPIFDAIKDFLPLNMRIKQLTHSEAYDILHKKDLFCDFIYNHDNDKHVRKHYLELLNTYKEVSIGGRLYNNEILTSGRKYDYKNKFELEKRCKFSIVVESCELSRGLVTEKIFHSILANTIPIYYGEKDVYKYINPKRFIDAKKYTDDELLDLIKNIDSNDDIFVDYICQKALVDDDFIIKNQQRLYDFLYNIFNQEPNIALRKPLNEFSTQWYKDKLIQSDALYNAGIVKIFVYLINMLFKRFRRFIIRMMSIIIHK